MYLCSFLFGQTRYTHVTSIFFVRKLLSNILDFAGVVELVIWSSSYSMSVAGILTRAHKFEVITALQELTLLEFSMYSSAIRWVSRRPFGVSTTKSKLSNRAKIRPFTTGGGSWDKRCFYWRKSAEDCLNLCKHNYEALVVSPWTQ